MNGQVVIETCPLLYVDMATWEAIKMADMYLNHGLAPMAGGILDQSYWFVEFAGFVDAERSNQR